MASRRKSTVPCMVPPREAVDSDQEMEEVTEETDAEDGPGVGAGSAEVSDLSGEQGGGADPDPASGGYECKYCSFQTSELNLFTMHVDTQHPDVVLNTAYVCVECDYHTKSYDTLLAHNARLHPGEDGFTRTLVKRNNETVVQQTLNDLTFDGSFVKEEEEEPEEAEDASHTSIALSKTPIMRIRGRAEPKKFTATHKMAVDDVIKVESEDEENRAPPTLSPAPPMTPAAALTPCLVPVSSPLQVHAVPQSIVVSSSNVLHFKGGSAGGGGGGGGVLPPGTLAQVLSALQQQHGAQTQTQLLIPISSIPTYNSAMDNNVLLVSAYNRFPYPSLSEIMGLSSQTKFSEEQIKVWFSAQRLKHGVSWTPEEVEEARRKKFNGTVQSGHQTITVIPANMAAAAANGLQSIFQTCQIVGQPGLILTQVGGNASNLPVASPITLTVAGVPGNQPKAAEPAASESKTEMSASSAGSDAAGSKPKKSKEQLAELKASYGRRQFATEVEISRLMQVTKLSKRAIKKWFSDTRYNQRNSRDHHGVLLSEAAPGRAPSAGGGRAGRSSSGSLNDSTCSDHASTTIVIDSSDDASDCSPTSASAPGSSGPASVPRVKFRHAFPDFTPQKFKEKTPEQLLLLEASFQELDTPSDEELSRLRAETKLTRREVDAWFTERRKMTPPAKDGDSGADDEKVKAASAQERHTTPPGGRKLVKKTAEQLHILKKAFVRSQWPTPEEYDAMTEDSRLPRAYIVNWFGDTRYACKNSNLKWYYLYQSGKEDEALNGGAKKKPRKRYRGWSRRTRRPNPCKASPQGGATAIKVKSGKAFLKDYFLRHRALSEKDLDDLVTKSSMSYEHVRDWFSSTARRVEEGKEPFSEEEAEGEEPEGEEEGEEEEEEEGEEEEEEEAAAEEEEVEHGCSEEEMEVKEQGEEASDDDCKEEEEEEEELEEEAGEVSQSQPPAEEQP